MLSELSPASLAHRIYYAGRTMLLMVLPLRRVSQSNALLRTGVAPERQKIMVKGGLLKDDQQWGKAGIKPGQKLMMMGTADAVPQAPIAKQVGNVSQGFCCISML